MSEMKKGNIGKIVPVPIGRIRPNPAQPRKLFGEDALARLAESIRRYGILQPLSVRRLGDGSGQVFDCTGISLVSEPDYELIAGERRLRAAKLAGLSEVPCLIIEADEKKSAELSIIENLQREDLNIFEQASAIAALIDIYGLTQEEAASHLSVSQPYVANKLRLLKMTPPERLLILEAGLTERHARTLLRITVPEERFAALKVIVSRGLNVAQTEEHVDRLLRTAKDGEKSPEKRGRGRKILILKDLRLFCNTVDRAVDTMVRAGIPIEREKRETDDSLEYLIRIAKRREGEKIAG